MALQTRTVTIQLREQVNGSRTVRFLPDLSDIDGVLLNKFYKVVTDATGAGSIALPVAASGTVRYKYELPKHDGGKSTGTINLAAGASVALDDLIIGGQPATDSIQNYIDAHITPQAATITGTSYSLQSTDLNKILVFTNGSAIALTVPSGICDAAGNFNCIIIQDGVGQITITAGAGATVTNSRTQNKTAGQYAICNLIAVSANTFRFGGDVT